MFNNNKLHCFGIDSLRASKVKNVFCFLILQFRDHKLKKKINCQSLKSIKCKFYNFGSLSMDWGKKRNRYNLVVYFAVFFQIWKNSIERRKYKDENVNILETVRILWILMKKKYFFYILHFWLYFEVLHIWTNPKFKRWNITKFHYFIIV